MLQQRLVFLGLSFCSFCQPEWLPEVGYRFETVMLGLYCSEVLEVHSRYAQSILIRLSGHSPRAVGGKCREASSEVSCASLLGLHLC